MSEVPAVAHKKPNPAASPGTVDDITARMERLPSTGWQVRARVLIGTATFFDAFDALTIAQVLPVLTPEWNLSGGQVGALISIGYAGQLLGALAFSWLAERHGRVLAMTCAILTFTLLSIACAFAWNYQSLLLFRTIQGFGLGGQVPIAAVYISEIARAQGRGKFVLVYELVFSVGVVAAGVVGFFVVPHGWHYMFLIGALPLLFVFFIRTRIPESPRWLAGRGRAADADTAMQTIERNVTQAAGHPLPEPRVKQSVARPTSTKWTELFRPPYLQRTLVVWAIWVGSYLVYYGISTWLPTLYRTVFKLPLDVSLRYGLISNVIGLAGAALCAFTIDYFGRRVWFSIALSGSAIFLFLLAMSGVDQPSDLLVYGSGAYFFATAAAIGVYLYTPELYPTRIRALGVGTATAWLRLSSIVGPILIGTFIGYGLSTIFVVFGVIAALFAIVVAVFAIETKNRVLEDVSP